MDGLEEEKEAAVIAAGSGIASAMDLAHIGDTGKKLIYIQTETDDNTGAFDGRMAKEEAETSCVINTEVKGLVQIDRGTL